MKAVYKTARALKFQYEQVTHHFVKPVRLDAYIGDEPYGDYEVIVFEGDFVRIGS